jgi:hypothetical protein
MTEELVAEFIEFIQNEDEQKAIAILEKNPTFAHIHMIMYLAVRGSGLINLVRALLEKNASVFDRNSHYSSALCHCRNVSVVKLLLDYGAAPSLTSRHQSWYNPLDITHMYGPPEKLEILCEYAERYGLPPWKPPPWKPL